jgi:hypothetical protein
MIGLVCRIQQEQGATDIPVIEADAAWMDRRENPVI